MEIWSCRWAAVLRTEATPFRNVDTSAVVDVVGFLEGLTGLDEERREERSLEAVAKVKIALRGI